jgi:hypothetical protein
VRISAVEKHHCGLEQPALRKLRCFLFPIANRRSTAAGTRRIQAKRSSSGPSGVWCGVVAVSRAAPGPVKSVVKNSPGEPTHAPPDQPVRGSCKYEVFQFTTAVPLNVRRAADVMSARERSPERWGILELTPNSSAAPSYATLASCSTKASLRCRAIGMNPVAARFSHLRSSAAICGHQ